MSRLPAEALKKPPPHELLYLDVQADEGGGSWARAKIQTLEKCPGWVATHPMEVDEICDTLKHLGFDNSAEATEISEANLYAELTPEDIKWLVDVEDGPGLAPGFGGIRIPYRCNFVGEGTGLGKMVAGSSEVLIECEGQRKLVDEAGEVLIAFSGATQWQDLQFALVVAREMRDHWDEKKDEFLMMDFSALKDWPEIEFWMKNLGLD